MCRICAAVMEDDLGKAVAKANKIAADIIEIRLDLLPKGADMSHLSKIRKPVMATCMPVWEGGSYVGTEGERASMLSSALSFVDYVTVELNMDAGLRDKLASEARAKSVKVVVANHDFEKTPSFHQIVEVLRREERAGADIAKVAYMPSSEDDVYAVLSAQLLSGIKIPAIALSMGELGRITRVVGPMLGGYLTFASTSHDSGTAPGQYTVDEMKSIKEALWDGC